jgi:autotransporter-associated beta strand protein
LVTGVAGVNGVNGGLGDTRNGANGSAAISIDAGAFLVNQGSVTGGSGGNGGQGGTTFFKTRGGDGGFAGAGAVLGGGAQGNNSGTITGGRGGDGGAPGSSYGTPRSGGIGVDAGASSTFTNSGTIIGGAGGNASSTSAGNGGVGLVLAAGSSLDNTGTIAGGAAGMSSSGAAGGIALVAENATIVNSGTLRGGTNSVGARAAAVILNGTANTLELRAGFNLQGSVIGNAASDTLLLGGAADATLQASGGTAAFSGIETLRKNGASTWTLLGDFTGATTIDEGTLLVGNGTTHGALFGAITNNGTLIFNSNSATTRADTLAGSGSIEKQGTGTLTFQTANTHTGTTTISAGTVVLANGGALGATTAGTSVKNGATLTLQNVAVGAEPLALNGTGVGSAGALTATGTASLAGTVMLESDTRIGVATPGHVLTLSGAISGNAALEKTGSGTLVLGGANTYTGSTTIAAGTLRFASPSAFYNNTSANWTAANIVVSSGATAVFNVGGVGEFTAANIDTLKALGTASGGFKNGAFIGFDTTNASGGVFTYNGSISNPNGGANTLGLVKLGSGTLLLSGSNTYSGDTFVHAGTLRLGAAGASSPNSALYVAPGAVFDANGFQPTFNMVTGSGQIDVGSAGFILAPPLGVQTLSVQLSGSGGLTLNGGGTVELGTANNFQGAATLAAGTLKLGVAGALPANVPVEIASGATLDLNSHAATLGRFAGAGNVALGSATLTIAQGDHTTFTGTISGSGGLAKSGAGRLTLTGTNTYSGATAITGGEIKLNGSAASSAFTLAGGGMLSGNGTVGALTIGSGGILSPGNSPGTTSAGNTTFAGGGSFLWELNSTGGAAGSNPGWDLLSISGSLTLNATPANKFTINLTSLTLANAAGSVSDFSSASNYSFAFVTATGGITGFDASAFTLDTTNFQNAFTGTWSIGQSGNALTLNYTASAIPEPSTYAGIAGAAMLGVALWCRRKKS